MEKETKPMLPESPRLPMEFLSRSWSLPALQLSKALSSSLSLPSLLVTKTLSCTTTTTTPATTIPEDNHCDNHHVPGDEDQPVMEEQKRGTSFSFASSSCSSQQLLIDRILSHSVPTPEQVSPMTSGRPSCSEAPTGILGGVTSLTSSHECHHLHQGDPDNLCSSSSTTTTSSCSPDPPFISPSLPFDKPLLSGGRKPTGPTGARTKTVGRWLKDRREKKKEETRVHNAHLHSAVSVAAVAAAVAATAAATAVTSKSGKDEQAEMTDAAVASAATLVAARCVEAAEAMGAARDQLVAAVSSAVNVQSHGDIMTLTAAAATALRGAATLKARMIKEVGNIAAVLPVERGTSFGNGGRTNMSTNATTTNNSQGDDLLGLYSEQLLARGFDLLKRTRKGDLHWKIVSVYINKAGQVILKMKSKHVAGTITKKKKKVLMEVLRDVPEWPERQGEGGEELRYFGVKTITHRVIEFECKNQQEYEIWTEGVSRLLSVMAEKTINHFSRHACIGVDVL